jgi:hypothetical protein
MIPKNSEKLNSEKNSGKLSSERNSAKLNSELIRKNPGMFRKNLGTWNSVKTLKN